ncbi:MAG: SufD family Fe-S cluster assembly protein [Clostridia bacterium]|nr:SufD family Fe-S cluster assembly protein [Clostridia bacterium]
MLKLNETPVRTSRIFGINNAKLNDIDIPSEIKEFEAIDITGDTTNIEVTNNISNADIKYGLNDELKKQIKEKSNQKIQITIKDQVEESFCLNFDFDEDNTQLVDDIEIISEENSKATIIIKYISNSEDVNFHNGKIKLISKENSDTNVIIVNLLNNKSNNFLTIENEVYENGKSNFTIIDFGAKNNISNYYSNLIGNQADNSINTIYIGKEDQFFDINYISELYGEKSNVNMEIQGALKDDAVKHFKGTIDFKKGAKKATGDENEYCMLLSKTARSKALPMLLCSEEDVQGNHASSAGKVDEKALFYIMSRGFSYKEAMKLIVKTKFSKILDCIQVEDLKQEIIEEIDKRLD